MDIQKIRDWGLVINPAKLSTAVVLDPACPPGQAYAVKGGLYLPPDWAVDPQRHLDKALMLQQMYYSAAHASPPPFKMSDSNSAFLKLLRAELDELRGMTGPWREALDRFEEAGKASRRSSTELTWDRRSFALNWGTG